MEKKIIGLALCMPFMFGCSGEEKNISLIPVAPEQVSANNVSDKEKPSYKQFFLLSKDLKFNKDLYQLEAIWSGKLVLYHNCLSILVTGDREILHTLVVPESYKILFDARKNIIGLEDIKSKERYALGEWVVLGGLAVDKEKMKTAKTVPGYCEQRLALPEYIKKR